MNNAGLTTTFEEGEKGQFELYRLTTVENSAYWTSYMKNEEGSLIPKFFTLKDVERKLANKKK